jgi:hypothetical protein
MCLQKLLYYLVLRKCFVTVCLQNFIEKKFNKIFFIKILFNRYFFRDNYSWIDLRAFSTQLANLYHIHTYMHVIYMKYI